MQSLKGSRLKSEVWGDQKHVKFCRESSRRRQSRSQISAAVEADKSLTVSSNLPSVPSMPLPQWAMSSTHSCALLLIQSFPSTYGEALRQAAESTQAAIQGAVLTGIATKQLSVALHPAPQAELSDDMLDACHAVLAALQRGRRHIAAMQMVASSLRWSSLLFRLPQLRGMAKEPMRCAPALPETRMQATVKPDCEVAPSRWPDLLEDRSRLPAC